MSKNASLLAELQSITPHFPEVEVHVPEWGRAMRLRGFSLRAGRDLQRENGEDDNDRMMLRTLAHAIVDGDERPLANDDGLALIETLSAGTVNRMARAYLKLTGVDEDEEKNSAAEGGAGSSSSLPSPSAGQSLN